MRIDMSYEERVMSVLSTWMGGANMREASEILARMMREETARSYEDGYRFAKDEARLVEEAVEAFV
jgi:hypothetical protein|tara:strand:+ start:1300 stop:1497 length:198 start_codon:yes stop_codon:yes gene_type:complete